MKKLILTGAAFALLTGTAQAQDVAAGEKVFKKCLACHAIGEGAKNKVGPVQNNLIGRTAGTGPDYKYSQAMKDAGAKGLVWNDETLDKYLENPKQFIPGNKMAFPGLKKADERANVIAYLKTFSPAATQ